VIVVVRHMNLPVSANVIVVVRYINLPGGIETRYFVLNVNGSLDST